MKHFIKNMTALCIGAMSLLVIDAASAAGPGPRGGGMRGGGGFRGGPGFGFRGGIGFGYRPFWGGYYRYGYPSIGLSIGYLPYGYLPFYFGSDLYYCYDGIYYRQYDDNYQVVAPPLGAEVPKLPAKAKSIMINNEQYYVLNGVYYKEVAHQDGTKGYQIVGKDGVLNTGQAQAPAPPQVGDIVAQLPPDCHTVNIGGKKYFVSPDDVYYEEISDGTSTSYKIVGVPEDQGKPGAPNNPPGQYNQ
ncbi:DUF6515 family protein [Mucilaginibacter paludis]|uniref:Uncharacterized protein n=1 Tax=Mucilaginibacter paludis DSM 18603 TaxID=714943 RepID=H1Y4G0_9SPHI|nr:DUF6515 family protein [Mucilaginibacter paludis]EHQ26744.1 hypothetical protein Mucpa_2630 [Mucilaginibacter paludis DSM 18603]